MLRLNYPYNATLLPDLAACLVAECVFVHFGLHHIVESNCFTESLHIYIFCLVQFRLLFFVLVAFLLLIRHILLILLVIKIVN